MSSGSILLKVAQSLGDFDLEVDKTIALSGVTALFGASGSGKTSLLRLISGLATPDAGSIVHNDVPWCDTGTGIWVPPHKRSVGYLFQDGRLFEHLSVDANLAFADKRSASAKEGSYSKDDIIDATDVGALLQRRPESLSGGERQRVALARTLLRRPKLLLFDEPLSALDRDRKSELLPFLERLPSSFDIPVIYVSHDVNEVSRIADRVFIMDRGRISSVGDVESVFMAAGIDGGRNPYERTSLLNGKTIDHDERLRLTYVQVGGNTLSIPFVSNAAIGADVSLAIAAQDIAIACRNTDGLSIQNKVPAILMDVIQHRNSAFCDVVLDVNGQELSARITLKSVEDLELSAGQSVFALIKSASFQS